MNLQRAEQTERTHRIAVRRQLLELLAIINPQDQITFGAMNYTELVVYARDWLNTEIAAISSAEEPKSAVLAME